MTSSEIALRCRCGTVRGVVELSPSSCNRIVCYCEDCRAFLRHLDRTDLVDAHGGTEIVQTSPALVRLTGGEGELRCIRLSDKGMIRFYSACCGTPMGNTISAGLAFVGLTRQCLDEGIAASGRSFDAVLGESVGFNAGSARGAPPPTSSMSATARSLLRIARLFFRAMTSRPSPSSPYFDPTTKRPRTPIEVLDPERRQRLRELDA